MTAHRFKVLIVEDDPLIAMLLADFLEEIGMQVCDTASSSTEAIRSAERHQPDLVLMDVRLEGESDGIDAAIEIDKRNRTPIIFVTGSSDPTTIARIHENYPATVLLKPIQRRQLRTAIEKVLGNTR